MADEYVAIQTVKVDGQYRIPGPNVEPFEIRDPEVALDLLGRRLIARHDEPEADDDGPIPGVRFASSAAEDLALTQELQAEDFEGLEPSSASGFTKADVESVIAALEDEEEDGDDEDEEDGEGEGAGGE